MSTEATPLEDQAVGTVAPLPAEAAVAVSEESHVDAIPRKLDRRFITAALMLVMVLASMEMTVTSTAMPTIIGELHGLEHNSWVASIYLLACTVTMPLYGRLADVLGRKRVVMSAISLFTLGSVLAAYSRSMEQLILFRGIQGLGAGGIMPVVLTILGDIFTLKERARIQGFFSAVWGLSSLAGPALGAFLVHTLGWRWVFLVNLPFGFLGSLVLAWKYHDLQKPHSTDLDLVGIGAMSAASFSLLALVSRLGPDGWSWPTIGLLTLITITCIAIFIAQERRTSNPVMPPELFLRRAVGPSILATFFFGAGFLSLDTYVPLYVQGGRGGGAAAAAGVVTPVMMTWALSSVIAAPLVIRWGFRKTALVGGTLIIAGFTGLFLCALFNLPRGLMTAVLALTGLGFGPTSMSYLLAAQDAVQWQQRGIVTSTISFFRTIGGAMGIGLLGAGFNFLSRGEMEKLRQANISPAAAVDPHLQTSLAPEALNQIRHMISSGLLWVFAAMLLLAIAQLLVTLLMPACKPAHAVTKTEAFNASCD